MFIALHWTLSRPSSGVPACIRWTRKEESRSNRTMSTFFFFFTRNLSWKNGHKKKMGSVLLLQLLYSLCVCVCARWLKRKKRSGHTIGGIDRRHSLLPRPPLLSLPVRFCRNNADAEIIQHSTITDRSSDFLPPPPHHFYFYFYLFFFFQGREKIFFKKGNVLAIESQTIIMCG